MAPNIVMILVDDADRKLFGYIPRIKAAIADQGAVAPTFILNHPLCAPSRASLFRGQYEHNTGVVQNGGAYAQYVSRGFENSNLATWLHASGYRTGLIGKYLNGYGSEAGKPKTWVPPGWDYWYGLFNDAGDSYDYDANNNGALEHHGHDASDYVTDVLTGKALEFLNAEPDRAFFLLLATKAPHLPAIPADKYANDYTGVTYPRGAQNPSFNEDDVRDKPLYVSRQDRLNAQEIALIDEAYQQRLRSMESVEDMVDALITKLGSRLANTYIIFTSDNGYHLGEHRLGHGKVPGGKNLMYEEDIAVPLWMRGPGIAAGRTVTQLIGNVDLAPTICEIAGVKPGINVDGRSFLPLVQGKSIAWRNRYLLERGAGGKSFAGIRSKDNYVFTELDNPRFDEIPGEYYNLASDPFELVNGYNSLSGSTRATLRSRVSAYRRCVGDSCRVADSS